MAPANQQIVTAYEECGMSPEEIAVDMGFEVEAVKMILLSHSQAFSDKALTKANEAMHAETVEAADSQPLFGDNEMRIAKATIKELCVSSEIDAVRFKAAEFIINEAKGRNDLKALKDTKFNVVMISETMSRARQAIERAKNRGRMQEAIAA